VRFCAHATTDDHQFQEKNNVQRCHFDPKELEAKVKAMYHSVAEEPRGEFHFEMGRAVAERLGSAPADLDRIPAESID
jgi:hypothetical protein